MTTARFRTSSGTRGDLGVRPVPRWKHVLTLDWARGPWNATLIEYYTHSHQEPCITGPNGDSTLCVTRKVGVYEMRRLGYTGFQNTTLRLGVKNIFDRSPPISNQSTTAHVGYDPTYTDPRGRTFYGSVRYVFK